MLSLIFRILILCLVVGLVLAWLNIRPENLLVDTWATIQSVFAQLGHVANWSVKYILLGAVIVVPIALIVLVLRLLGRRA